MREKCESPGLIKKRMRTGRNRSTENTLIKELELPRFQKTKEMKELKIV